MLKTASDEEEVTATTLPIIDGTYRIRSVGRNRLLAHLPYGDLWPPSKGFMVGFHRDADVEQEKIPNFVCDWIIERFPNSNPDAGMPGFKGAPREPWYRICNKDTGQILIENEDQLGLWGHREDYMGENTTGTLQEMWRIIKFEGKRLRTGPYADDTGTWFKIQNVASGNLLTLVSDEFKLPSRRVKSIDPAELKKILEDYDLAWAFLTENGDERHSGNNPEYMWNLDFAKPAVLLDLELHTGASPQQGQEVLTTETSMYLNATDSEQEHTFIFNYEYSDSYNFRWENSLSVGVEVEVSSDFAGFSASTKTSVQNTLTVGEEQTNTYTYSKTYEFPVKVPPRSSVKASMIVYKGSYAVGFTAKLKIGSEIREERGTLRAQLGAGVTQYSVKQVKLDEQTDVPHRGNGGKKSKQN